MNTSHYFSDILLISYYGLHNLHAIQVISFVHWSIVPGGWSQTKGIRHVLCGSLCSTLIYHVHKLISTNSRLFSHPAAVFSWENLDLLGMLYSGCPFFSKEEWLLLELNFHIASCQLYPFLIFYIATSHIWVPIKVSPDNFHIAAGDCGNSISQHYITTTWLNTRLID